MRALLRKNLWLWKPTRSANVAIFILAFAFSILDCSFQFPESVWLIVLVFSIILAQAGASSAMNVDLKDDNERFLEYLPIKWSHVWIANWLDQLLACILIVPILCWCRVLTWLPSDAAQLRYEAPSLFQSRWLLPLILFSGICVVYSYAIMWRALFKSDKAAILVTYLGGIPFTLGPLAIFTYWFVFPSIWDLWLWLLCISVLFSSASFAMFVLNPRHWSASKRFLICGLPTLAAALCFELGTLWIAATRWQELDWREPSLTSSALIVSEGDKPLVIAQVISQRSGIHAFVCDPGTGKSLFIDRNAQLLSSQGSNNQIVYKHISYAPKWLDTQNPLIAFLPAENRRSELLPNVRLDNGNGRLVEVNSAEWSLDGRILLLSAYDDQHRNCVLLIADAMGRITQRLEIKDDGYLLSPSGRILLNESSPRVDDEVQTSSTYRIHDLSTGQESTFTLPGQAFCFSDDLQRCAFIQTTEHDGLLERTMWMMNIPNGEPRIILKEGSLPPVHRGDVRNRFNLALQSSFDSVSTYYDPAIAFDRDFKQAILLHRRFEASTEYASLLLIDLSTGTSTLLVPESKFGKTPANSGRNGVNSAGFTPDGKRCVYQTESQVVSLSVSDQSELVTQLEPEQYNYANLSPDKTRFILQTSNKYKVISIGNSTPTFQQSGGVLQWLDNDRLISTKGPNVDVVDLNGTLLHHLIPTTVSP